MIASRSRPRARAVRPPVRSPILRASPTPAEARGRLFAGTSGFSYPGWAPHFYPSGLRAHELLPYYARRLPAVELNATYRARPRDTAVARWVAATPPDFRFAVKAQRGATFRALTTSPTESVAWLLEPLRGFGDRLGIVLFRVPDEMRRDGPRSDERLARLLAAWPRDVPLAVELRDPSWHVDETFAALRAAGAALCVTEVPEDPEPPVVWLTGRSLYLRLRRHDYDAAAIGAWADRMEPFLAVGHDVYVFFRHDEVGRGPELALALEAAVADRAGRSA